MKWIISLKLIFWFLALFLTVLVLIDISRSAEDLGTFIALLIITAWASYGLSLG